MTFTYRIRPGDNLDADAVEQNFDDLASLVNLSVNSQSIEKGAAHTRHLETNTAWKSLEEKSASSTALTGTPAVVIPTTTSAYTTFDTQAYLVRAAVVVQSTGASPHVILRIKIASSTVIQRYWNLMASGKQSVRIAWLAVAAADTTTVELEAEGNNCTLTGGTMSVLAVRR